MSLHNIKGTFVHQITKWPLFNICIFVAVYGVCAWVMFTILWVNPSLRSGIKWGIKGCQYRIFYLAKFCYLVRVHPPHIDVLFTTATASVTKTARLRLWELKYIKLTLNWQLNHYEKHFQLLYYYQQWIFSTFVLCDIYINIHLFHVTEFNIFSVI